MTLRLTYMAVSSFIGALMLVALACSPAPAPTTSATPAPMPSPSPTTSVTTSYTISVATKDSVGGFLVDGKGVTLYWTTRDAVGQSDITGAVLANWPAFYASSIVVPSSLSAADFSSIMRSDGSNQTTYKGWPLYYFIGDKAPGDTLGQGIGGVWSVVDPAASAPVLVPTLTIVSPANNATVPAGDLAVNIKVGNFNVVDKQGQANVPGEGHVHFYLDVAAPTTPGKPAIPASGVWAHVSGTTHTFTNVTPGTHTITVQLVNNDHTPLIPVITAQVTITVVAPPATTLPPTTTPPPKTILPPTAPPPYPY